MRWLPTAVVMPLLIMTFSLLICSPASARVSVPDQALLYEADWSQGSDSWELPASWKVENGVLVGDGTSDDSAICHVHVPYRPETADYAVEAR